MSRTTDSEFETKRVLSRDDVVEGIVRLNEDEESAVVGDREHQLRRLIQTLRNRKNRFALIFVVCNEAPLRQRLTQVVKETLSDQNLFELHLTGKETALLDNLLRVPGAPHPLFVYGLENLLPSSDQEKLRREETIQELQLRREQFRKLGRPLVLWMPEYAYELIGQQAVDFWSWQSGAFFFTEIQTKKVRIDQSLISNRLAKSRLHQLPLPPRDFAGRETELEELRQALRHGGATISGVQGMGSVGKTALALVLADELKDQYPDAQIYLDLRGTSAQPLSPAEVMWHVVSSFHPDMKRPDDGELPAWYRDLLNGHRALLFYDNAKDGPQIEPLLPPAHCLLLVTSRRHFKVPGMFDKNLDEMTGADANKLLLRIAPHIDEHAAALAEQCGYLPIALCAAASVLKVKRSLSPEDYLKRLQDRKERLTLRDETRNLSVEACFDLSYELLSEELQRRWRMLAIFPTDFDAPAAAAVWQVDVDHAKDSLAELEAYSLLDWDEAARRYSLHDLARDFADTRLSETEREQAGALHATHYLQILSTADDLYQKGGEAIAGGLSLFDNERVHIEAGQEWAAARSAGDEQAAHLCNEYPGAGAYVLNLRQHPRDFIRWHEAAMSAARQLKDHAAEGGHLGNLGVAYADLGETRRAIEFHEQALVISREIGDRRGEGNALGNLGVAYKNLGETRRAIEFHEQALTVLRDLGDRRGEGIVLGNLGLAYADLGETRRAIEFYAQYLTIAREIGDRRGEGSALGNLGVAYKNLGETRRAIEFYEQYLTIVRDLGDRRGEGTALGNLGNAYNNLGETLRAIEFYEQALVIGREIGDRRGEGNALGNLGVAYKNLGETRRAIEFYEQALVIDREIGDRHGEGADLGNLGSAYADLGETRRAIEFHEQYLTIAREIGDRRGEGNALGNLGLAYAALGETRRAIEFHEQALVIDREIGDRRGEGSALGNLGNAYAALGETEKAMVSMEAAVKILEEIESPSANIVRGWLEKLRGESG